MLVFTQVKKPDVGQNKVTQIESEKERRVVFQSAFFQGLPEDRATQVVAAARLVKVRKNAVLFRQEEEARFTYLLVSGRLKLHQGTMDGAQTLLRVIGPGQIMAIISVLNEATYPATATAERDSVALSWDSKTLDRLFLDYPRLCRNALEIVSARTQEMQLRFGELAAERTERRLARAVLRLADQLGKESKEGPGISLDLKLSRQDLAEMIGATLFSVSRILGAWQRQGWAQVGRQKVRLLDKEALHRIADE